MATLAYPSCSRRFSHGRRSTVTLWWPINVWKLKMHNSTWMCWSNKSQVKYKRCTQWNHGAIYYMQCHFHILAKLAVWRTKLISQCKRCSFGDINTHPKGKRLECFGNNISYDITKPVWPTISFYPCSNEPVPEKVDVPKIATQFKSLKRISVTMAMKICYEKSQIRSTSFISHRNHVTEPDVRWYCGERERERDRQT